MSDTLKFLYLGDIMGSPGRRVVAELLPKLKKKYKVDLVLAQSENVTHGKGVAPHHMRDLQAAGVDVFTGGNHSVEQGAALDMLADPNQPVLSPINQHGSRPAWGAKTFETPLGKVLVISLLGTTFPGTQKDVDNPLKAIDNTLRDFASIKRVATIVNFHGDLSSEKRVAGYFLDGRVTAVIGDHWHVPTADAMVLPKGTAHITDVGMCGTLHSSLGVTTEIIIKRWRDGVKNKNEIAEGRPWQLNAVFVECDTKTGLAKSIKSINILS